MPSALPTLRRVVAALALAITLNLAALALFAASAKADFAQTQSTKGAAAQLRAGVWRHWVLADPPSPPPAPLSPPAQIYPPSAISRATGARPALMIW
jgi:hypothetical protein